MRTNKRMTEKHFELSELPDVATSLITELGNRKKWLFRGDLGAGKTTLIKTICEQLGVEDIITSPTFSIVNEYQISKPLSQPLYHMDLYRIKNLEEALQLGIEDYLDDEHYCFIEWPEVIEAIWPEFAVNIQLEIGGDSLRKISYF